MLRALDVVVLGGGFGGYVLWMLRLWMLRFLDDTFLDVAVLDYSVLDFVNAPYKPDLRRILDVAYFGRCGFGCCVLWVLRFWTL